MRILFCQPTLERSGSEMVLLEIVGGLRTDPGMEMHVLAGKDGPLRGEFGPLVRSLTIVRAPKLRRSASIILAHLWSYGTVLRALRRIRRSSRPDLVYVNTIAFPQAAVAARLCGLPCAVHVHEVATTYPKLYYRYCLLVAALCAARIIAVCRYITLQKGIPLHGRFDARTRVVPNSSSFAHEPRPRPAERPFRLLAVTPIDRRKGVEDLVLLARELDRRMGKGSFTLSIVGRPADTRLYKRLMERVRADGLEGAVVFYGEERDIAGHYEKAHVLLSASRSEALPRTLVEAANFALPAVTTDAGGSGEVVIDGRTGFVVPVGNYQTMAERVVRLATDPVLYDKMSKEAYARYRAEFTRERMIARLRDALRNVR